MSKQKDNPINHCADVCHKRQQAKGHLICECGSDHFFLFKRNNAEESFSAKEAARRLRRDYGLFGASIAKDKNGVIVVRKQFLFFKWGERPLSDYMPSKLGFQYVSAKCERCGKEIVIFDARSYLPLDGESTKYGELGEIKWDKKASPVECVVDSLDPETGEFGRIRVYKVKDGKRKLFFDHEV